VRGGHIVASDAATWGGGFTGRLTSVKRALIGRPLATADEAHERLGVFKGLAVFASDNISSSAYATEEIMRVLVIAGAGALSLTMPLTVALVLVLLVVVVSYQQTIQAYPSGGGSYIVASENLGARVGLVAAAALLIDYILTVAVSTSAGVAALTSVFPGLFDFRVVLGVGFILVLCVGNLRGVRESGTLFSLPTYVYLVSMLGLVGYGLVRYTLGEVPAYSAPAGWHPGVEEGLGFLLILRAFSSGAVALTGTEAVSNGVPAFKPPEARHARAVLVIMAACFSVIFLGISFLSGRLGLVPDPSEQQTVLSQLTAAFTGEGSAFHYVMQLSTAVLLVLAANTAFADFPRLASILARDRFMPRWLQFRGDRLAFTGGIASLACIAIVLVVVFGGSVTRLIPLYTVGVFVAFTLSQSGMVRHWFRLRHSERRWRRRAIVNGLGAATTGLVALEVGLSKFLLGAWMVLLLIPLLVAVMWAIHKHYVRLDAASRPETPVAPGRVRPRVIVPIEHLNVPARQALAFASAMSPDAGVTAVHVTDSVESANALRLEWDASDFRSMNLLVIESPYRSLNGPLIRYIDAVRGRGGDGDTTVVVLPEYVPRHWWEHLLHNQTALRLKAALLFHPGVIVASVPYHAGDGRG